MSEGKLRLNRESFDPRVVVKECLELIAYNAKMKGVELLTEFKSDLPPYPAHIDNAIVIEKYARTRTVFARSCLTC